MSNTLQTIALVTIPAAIVFLTAYYMLERLLTSYRIDKMAQLNQQRQSSVTPLRFQALERLSLCMDRISFASLLSRLGKEFSKAKELEVALLYTIQQEYEHNITQQVYVSDELWSVIQAARDYQMQILSQVIEKIGSTASADELQRAIYKVMEQQGEPGLQTAQSAIRKEAASMF